MKKICNILFTILLALILTFFVFESMSWYHFGDIPTKVVLVRLIGFFLILAGLFIGIEEFIYKKSTK